MKKSGLLVALLAALALLLSACQPEGDTPGAYSGRLVLEGSHVYEEGTTLSGALVMLDGEAVLAPGTRVAGPVFLIGGSLSIDGKVSGDVTAIGGSLIIGPAARIDGDLRAGNAELDLSSNATITGQMLTGPASGVLPGDLFAERPLRDQLTWLLPESLFLACAAFLTRRFVPKPLIHISHAAVRHPVISGAMGLLAGLVGLVLLVVIAYTLILIPVSFIGFLLGFLAVGYGWVGIGIAAGSSFAKWQKLKLSSGQLAFLGTLVFMLAFNLFTLLPVIGDIAGIAAAAVSLGAVVLTRFGLREFIPETDIE